MPTKGLFSVDLVEANTKEPFKQHPGRNGLDGYIEVEPGLDYFIRIKNNSRDITDWKFKVDGVSLGYNITLSYLESSEEGLWEYDSVSKSSTMNALSFHKAIVHPRTMDQEEKDNKNDVGVIEVSIYEKILTDGYYYHNDLSHNFGGGSTKINVKHAGESKKFLKSQVGHTQNKTHDDGRRENFVLGKKLETIKIKYCSTVGLIIDGVLAKPPTWEWFKMIKPQASIQTPPKMNIEPTLFTNETRDGKGNVVETKQYEMFDLTACDI